MIWCESSRRSRRFIARKRAASFDRRTRSAVLRAVRALFESWDNPRETGVIGVRTDHPGRRIGTAVNSGADVVGNKGDRSAPFALTRDTSNGRDRESMG